MKEIIKKIDKLLDQCFDTDDIMILGKNIIEIRDAISNLHLKLYPEVDFFVTYLNNKVLKRISIKIESIILEHTPPKSLTNTGVANKIIKKLRSFQIVLFKDYHKYLKGCEEYENFVEEQIKIKASNRDLLLSQNLATSIEFHLTDYFKGLADKSSSVTFNYFKDSFDKKDDIDHSRQELLIFSNQLDETDSKLKLIIDKEVLEIKTLEDSERSTGFEDIKLPSGEIETIDLRYQFGYDLVEQSNLIKNLKYHKEVVKNLSNKLYKNFLFLKDFEPVQQDPKTVFVNVEYGKLDLFCEHFKEFLERDIKIKDIKKVFTLKYSPASSKINLINGNLNDYGFLLYRMRQYFIDPISNRSKYGLWWSERFTFNNKTKTKKAVSNMVTSAKKDVSRSSSKKETILKIINTLPSIPQ